MGPLETFGNRVVVGWRAGMEVYGFGKEWGYGHTWMTTN